MITGATIYLANTLMPVNPKRLLKIITPAKMIVSASTAPQL